MTAHRSRRQATRCPGWSPPAWTPSAGAIGGRRRRP